MNLFSLLLTLNFTVPSFNADTSRFAGCGDHDPGRPETVMAVKLYRALCGGTGAPIYQRTISCLRGQRISFDGGPDCATWWVTAVDAAGNESSLTCARGYTVNVPSVSVAEVGRLARQGKLFDLSGRRLREVTRSGIYYLREGAVTRPLVVMR